jgi:hypothetical protein
MAISGTVARAARLAGLLILAACGSTAASAAESADPPVLYFGTPAGAAGSTAHDALTLLGIPQADALGARPLVEVGFGDAAYWPAQGEAELCPPGSPPVDLGERTSTAMRAILGWDYATAIDALSPLQEGLACFDSPVDGPALGRAALLLGYAHFEGGNPSEARSAFALAAAFDSGVVWDEDFPPDAQHVFRAAVEESNGYADVQLRFGGKGELRELIEVDEAPLSRKGLVRPGLHLLGVPAAGGGHVRIALRLAPDRIVDLLPTEELVTDWLAGAADSPNAARALGAAMDRDGLEEALLVDLATGRRFEFRADIRVAREQALVTSELFEPAPPVRTPRNSAVELRRRRTAGIVLAGGGGLVAVGGFIAHGATYSMGLAETQRSRYEWEQNANTAGFVVGMVGIGTCAAGLVMALLPRPADSRVTLIPGPSTTLQVRF